MAIDLAVSVTFTPVRVRDLVVTSATFGGPVVIPYDPATAVAVTDALPPWARLIGEMVSATRPPSGGTLQVDGTLPAGAGLSSSAALSVALAEVLGATGSAEDIAHLCQQAEHRAGVPVGIMDPLVCAGGRRGHALLVDAGTGTTRSVRIPPGAEFVVVDSGERRDLRGSPYAERVAECAAAAALIGPLGAADDVDVAGVRDPVLRRRARHVVTECRRVHQCVDAFESDDLAAVGALLTLSHLSLADDFAASTPALDDTVRALASRPGVLGARMTGAGFGGCVVALCHPGALDPSTLSTRAWRVAAVDGTVAARSRVSHPRLPTTGTARGVG
jgi:galactokinase